MKIRHWGFVAIMAAALTTAGCGTDEPDAFDTQVEAWEESLNALEHVAQASVSGPVGASANGASGAVVFEQDHVVAAEDIDGVISAVANASGAEFAQATVTLTVSTLDPAADNGRTLVEVSEFVDEAYVAGHPPVWEITLHGDGSPLG